MCGQVKILPFTLNVRKDEKMHLAMKLLRQRLLAKVRSLHGALWQISENYWAIKEVFGKLELEDQPEELKALKRDCEVIVDEVKYMREKLDELERCAQEMIKR